MTAREVLLDGGSPWGFRMHGGADIHQPLKISRVNPGSKASIKGVREGDLITSINGQSTKDVTNSEAHALLKSAGDKLRLGLNEDCCASPKRRQYKSVLQETHSETIKRSSISSSSTSYTISTTKETKLNGTKADEDGPKETGDSKENGASHKSLSLNGSTDSTLTNSSDTKGADKTQDGIAKICTNVTADNANSRSRRRRANRRKAKQAKIATENKTEEINNKIEETVEEDKEIEEEIATNVVEEVSSVNVGLDENYRVESPKLDKSKKKNGTGTVVKSRSLDSEEMLKITELSENSESEDVKIVECNAIVAEADSDVEWEVTKKLELTNLTPHEEKLTSRISPEEERDLRTFLKGLDLVTSPQVAATEVQKSETKSKRAKKREQLSQYFLPVYQNPRFLDAISEEGSDLSDREQKDKKKPSRNVKRPENIETPILVKVIETPILKEVICSTETVESISQAEIVHLDDSSSSSESPVENNSNAEPIYENVNNSISKGAARKEAARKCETGSVPSSQLTPPPTPDSATPEENDIAQHIKNENVIHASDAAFEKEFKEVLKEQENVNNLVTPKLSRRNSGDSNRNTDTDRNVTKNKLEIPQISVTNESKEDSTKTPQVSRSNSSESSDSSVGTTQCTALYNPMVSSIGDVNSLLKDLESLKDGVEVGSLKEICLKKLVSLPFGADILEELAVVSKSLEEFTEKLPKTQFHLPSNTLQALINSGADDSNTTFALPVPSPKEMNNEKWVGLPTEDTPNTLICLSPHQKEFLDSKRTVEKEADKFLDLHDKFSKRSSYEKIEKVEEKKVVITSISKNVVESSGGNRLLDIIKSNKVSEGVNGGIKKDMTLEKEVGNNLGVEEGMKRTVKTDDLEKLRNEARAKAQDLTEWLHLARNPNTVETKRSESTNNSPSENSIRSRRRSLPHEMYVHQMQYLIEKEKQIQKELEELESEKRKLTSEMYEAVPVPLREFAPSDYRISKNGDIAVHEHEYNRPRPKSQPQDKIRQEMYEEYMNKVAAREERKQNKVIKISLHNEEKLEEKHVETTNDLEHEFMDKVKKRMDKFGLKRDDSHEKSDGEENRKPVLVMDGGEITEMKKIPKHLQELINLPTDGIWSPGQKNSQPETSQESSLDKTEEGIPPVWTPRSAGSSPTLERKEFRPVNFESPTLGRKVRTKSDGSATLTQTEPPWKSESEKRLPTSFSAPGPGFSEALSAPRLPKAQNPTITLLQKAREGQIPKAAALVEPEKPRRHSESQNTDLVYQVRTQDYISDSDTDRPKKITIPPKKYEGIGPTTKDGMPITLRSEVRDSNMSQWYKKMYDTIHKQKPSRYDNDEYVTVRYKQRRGRYPYTTGYLSEPEPGAYDSDAGPLSDSNYSTLDRRRPQAPHNMSSTLPRNTTTINYKLSDVQHANEVYRNQPGRIENYTPGRSSISEHEAKKWWDEVMDIFDGHLEQQKRMPQTKGYMSQALKESGYESDSTLVFRRRDDTAQQLSPLEQREVYKNIQKGGDVPLHGLRKPAPERPKEPEGPPPPPKGHYDLSSAESPRKYVENEVTIHYRTPVRQEVKEALSEDELAKRQADAMRKIYEEERRRKYLQELHDMNSRRHTDNFIPSQKSPISLNRYDDFGEDLSPRIKARPRSPEPRLVARALYNFVGQTARELTFKKGDIIHIRRQVDKNWYEGDFNAMVGLFPANYVEIVPYDGIKTTPRKTHEGQARAKYNFIAQTHLELSLAKGELVVITRRVDDNWFEGKIGGRKGIFPVSYVEVLIDPSDPPPAPSKPVASPAAHSLLLNGSSGGKESMGNHSYVPTFATQDLGMSYRAKPVQITSSGTYGSLKKNPVGQALHIETQSEPIPYRALYKYRPQNEDELELLEGDTVYVLEKCNDGWYVGSSDRTGAFGTFPGNYVERI